MNFWTDDSVDSGLVAESVDRLATYVMLESRDRLELTVSPVALQVLTELFNVFTQQAPPTLHKTSGALTLTNDLAPDTSVTLLSKTEVIQYYDSLKFK